MKFLLNLLFFLPLISCHHASYHHTESIPEIIELDICRAEECIEVERINKINKAEMERKARAEFSKFCDVKKLEEFILDIHSEDPHKDKKTIKFRIVDDDITAYYGTDNIFELPRQTTIFKFSKKTCKLTLMMRHVG